MPNVEMIDAALQSETAVDEGMDVLEDITPPDMEPMITGVSGVMRDKTRKASKNALEEYKKGE